MKKVVSINVHILFLILSALVFSNIVFFHFDAFHSILVSSIWKNPLDAMAFYLPKVGISIFIGGSVLLFKRKGWSVVLLLLLNVWMLANIVYWRSYHSFLDALAIGMAGNLNGYLSSVLFYIKPLDFLPFVFTVIYGIIVFYCARPDYSLRTSLVVLCAAYLMCFFGGEFVGKCYARDNFDKGCINHYFNPFSYEMRWRTQSLNVMMAVRQFSVFHQIGFIVNDVLRNANQEYKMSLEDMNEAHHLFQSTQSTCFEDPLIIIIFESLEDWVVNPTAMPNLARYMNNEYGYIHVRHIQSEVKAGNSMDGQMIINTGVLPISQGAVPYSFPRTKLPGIAENAKGKTVVVVPHDIRVWNQLYMSANMGYDTTISVPETEQALFENMIKCRQEGYQVIQGVTIASHAPFTAGAMSTLELPNDMPQFMSNYMKAVFLTDSMMSPLLKAFDEDSLFVNATIVITGDHSVLYDQYRKECAAYCNQNNLDYSITNPDCPLIILSKKIQQPIVVDNIQSYQMDIFPTIMNFLGVKDYYWKGVGVNILDSTQVNHRTLTEGEAYLLSDKLIRSNYFISQIEK